MVEKSRMHRLRPALAVTAALWLAACSATFDFAAPPGEAQLYSMLYPYYIEFCAVSQIRKKPGFGADTSGGWGGHSVLYLNGVCRDRDAGYPTIMLCADDVAVAEYGVGLSANANFKNANWVVTEGRHFFFRGGLSQDERLTRAAYEQTQAEAKRMGIFDGIEFHPEVFDDMPPEENRRDYMYDISIATDYAITLGRDRYCARVPMSRDQMRAAVAYLNGVNAIYKDGETDFVWNILQNNCAHLTHNALAAAGIWDEWKTERFILLAALDFPVPKNEFVNLMLRTNDTYIADPRTLYDDPSARRSLIEFNRLPNQPGALAEAEQVMQNNDIYETKLHLIFYDDAIVGGYQRRFRTIFSEPRYTDVQANLRYFSSLYRNIAEGRRAAAYDRGAEPPSEAEGFAAFRQRFYDYIAQEAAEIDTQLGMLEKLPSLVRYGQ
jgi:hypothetical protein